METAQLPVHQLHLNKELHRLYTFYCIAWNHSLGMPSPSKLARNGFYCRGNTAEVICYMCNVVLIISEMLNDLEEKHRQLSPNCKVVCGTATDNISLPSPQEVIGRFENDSTITGTDDLDASPASRLIPSASFRPLFQLLKDAFDRLSRRGLVEIGELSTDVIDRNNPDFGRLRYERVRLSTYSDWPERAHANPAVLAFAGFFYTGTADRVQCAFCRGFLRNWVLGDVPADEHKKHFPDCPFVRRIDVGNVPLQQDTQTSLSSSVQQLQLTDTERPRVPRLVARPLTSGQIPKHPEFADEDTRVASFRGKIVPRGQDVGVLANAGFFHVGPLDNVKCFFCDGGLKNWQANDDPWEEHAKWFPRCGYLLSQRPQEYVRIIQDANRANLVMQQNLPPNIAGTPLALPAVDAAAAPAAARFPVEPREIKARMDSPAVKAVLEMGYSKDIVRRAISNQLSMTGDDFSSAASLVTAVIHLQEQQDQGLLAALPALQPAPVSTNAATAAASVTTPSAAPDAAAAADSHSSATNDTPGNTASKSTTSSTSASKSSRSKKRNRKRKAKVNQGNAEQATGEEAGLDDDKEVEGKQEAETEGEEGAAESSSAAALAFCDPDTASLLEENRQLKEAKTCKICMDEEVNTVFLPCGHLACCNNCAPALRHCPICRAFIRGTVRIFLP